MPQVLCLPSRSGLSIGGQAWRGPHVALLTKARGEARPLEADRPRRRTRRSLQDVRKELVPCPRRAQVNGAWTGHTPGNPTFCPTAATRWWCFKSTIHEVLATPRVRPTFVASPLRCEFCAVQRGRANARERLDACPNLAQHVRPGQAQADALRAEDAKDRPDGR